jgi:DNA-directed RNA polymerase subunit RPC12/RpoP
MTQDATSSTTDRVGISCPGCGRHDVVDWPRGAETFHWKCFNCRKEFDLSHKKSH